MQERRPGRERWQRSGAALVELALVLSLLVIIVFGCVDLGRFASVSIAVTNAAREGANFGSAHPVTPATEALWAQKIRQVVEDEMSGLPGFRQDMLTVDPPTLVTDNADTRVRVHVTYPFQVLVPLFAPSRFDISRAADMPVVH